MKTLFDRVLVVQSQEELRSYTCSLLSDLGFRHVLQAANSSQAERILESAKTSKRPVQLVVFDDSLAEGSMALQMNIAPVPCMVISDAHNPRNLRIAARLGVSSLVFRPYGKDQLLRAIHQLI